jgi:PAS domain S-box-containing protein
MELTSGKHERGYQVALVTFALVGLYLSSLYSYLLFHCLAEMFSIVVACGIFVLGWNSRRYMRSGYLVFIAIAYLFIAFLDLLHTLSYKGMGVFREYDFYANQLWIATRGMESLSLLIAFLFVDERRRFSPYAVFCGFIAVTGLVVASIFWWKVFPICFVEGVGLTPFKKNGEYVICALLLVSLWVLHRMRDRFEPSVARSLALSLVFTVGAELAFTFYVSNYGFSNLVGHYLKIFSFLFIYKAIIETGIRKPYDLIFLRLKASEEQLKRSQQAALLGDFDLDSLSGRMTWSDQMSRILGYESEGVSPTFDRLLSHVDPADRAALAAVIATSPDQGRGELLFRFSRVDNGQRWGKLTYWADAEPDGARIFGAVQDVTELTVSRNAMQWQSAVNASVAECMESFLSRRFTVDELADMLLKAVLRLTGSTHGVVASVDPDSEAIVGHAGTSAFASARDGALALKEGSWQGALLRRCVDTEQPFFFNDPAAYCAACELPEDSDAVPRVLGAPGGIGGTVYGLVALADGLEPYTEDILHTVSRFANVFVLALSSHESGQALARRDTMLQGFLNALNESALLLAPDGTVLFCNRTMAQRLNTTVEALIGHNVWPWFSPELAESRRERVGQAYALGIDMRFEDVREGRTFENLVCPLTESGRVTSLAILSFDITERRQAELELLKLKRSVENSPISVVVTDTRGVIEYVNPAFSRVTGYTRDEAVGQKPSVLKSGIHDDAFYRSLWETVSSGLTWASEMCSRKKNGELFWEQVTISPVRRADGTISNYVAIKEDISDRKDLERLKEDVERTMRHDLKSPLSGIVGLPRVMLTDDNLTPAQVEMLEAIEEAGERMLRMVELSLDMFKMEVGTYVFRPEPVDVLAVLRRVVRQVRTQLTAKGLSVQATIDGVEALPHKPFMILSEERLLHSLLSNLLVNAVEASPRSGIIDLEISSATPVRLVMRNEGVVPQAVREHFFEKYRTFGKSSGTGLGTYSAKLLAEAMGYSIAMETSDADNATAITITLSDGLKP